MDVRSLKAFIRLIRLPYWLMEGILCVLFMITFQRGFYKPVLMGLAVLTMAFVGAGGSAINDYFDCDSDAITHPDRPIPSHQISPATALQFSALMFLAGLGVSIAINPVVLGIVWLIYFVQHTWKRNNYSMHQDGVGFIWINSVGLPQSIRTISGPVVLGIPNDKVVAVFYVSKSNIICHKL